MEITPPVSRPTRREALLSTLALVAPGKFRQAGSGLFGFSGDIPTVLTFVDFTNRMVIQRAAGQTYSNVFFNFTYTGPAPSVVQAQVMQGATTIVGWTTLTNLTCSGGNGYGQCHVPQGAGYTANMRLGTAGATQSGTAVWGVGIVVLATGQSDNGVIWSDGFGGGGEAVAYNAAPQNASVYTDGGWNALNSSVAPIVQYSTPYVSASGNVESFCRRLSAAAGCPVGFVARWAGGTNFYNLYNAGGTWAAWWWGTGNGSSSSVPSGLMSTTFQNQPSGTCGDIEMVFFSQGGSDGTVSLAATWGAELAAWYTQLLGWVAWAGRTGATLGFGIEIIKECLTIGAQPALDVIRQAQINFVATQKAAGNKVEIFATLTDLPVGGVDFTGSDAEWTRAQARLQQLALYWLGAYSYSGRGSKISSVTRSGAVITVNVGLDSNGATKVVTAAGADYTTTPAVTGFYVSTDNFATGVGPGTGNFLTPTTVKITGATVVTITLPSAPGGAVYVKYLGGGSDDTTTYDGTHAAGECPDITTPVYDNAVVQSCNPGPLSLGYSGSSDTLGFPLQPSVVFTC